MEENNLHTENNFLAKWLEGEITDEALKEYVSKEDFSTYQKLKYGIVTYSKLESPLDTSLSKIKSRISKNKKENKSIKHWWFVAVAASVILFFGLFNYLHNNTITIDTNFGEQKTFALLDGSEVILNSKSEISYNSDDWESNRALFLTGEAFFKVKKGSTFTVNTDNGLVTVLGTEFNVNSKGDYFQVVCYEGKVMVKNKDTDHILTPKKHIRRINGNDIETWESDKKEPTWINGESSFERVPLAYVIKALSEQYNVQFLNKNINETDLYTGSFTHSDLNTALKTVFDAMQIQYFKKENGRIELRRF